MNLLSRFLPRTDFESYEDFRDHFAIRTPEHFNFAYDVVDVYAREAPDKRAMVWCNDAGGEETFTFADLKRASDKAANLFLSAGVAKGDHVMLILKGRYPFWFCLLGLHKIGAIAVPATHMLTSNDIAYRIERAGIKLIVSVEDGELLGHVDAAHAKCGDVLKGKFTLNGDREGWRSFSAEFDAASEVFQRPVGDAATVNSDVSLVYFSSGTAGFPKMVQHDFAYPLGIF